MRIPRVEGLRRELRALEIERERLQQRLRALAHQIGEYRAALLSLSEQNLTPQNSVALNARSHEKKNDLSASRNHNMPAVSVLNPLSRTLKRE